MDHLERVAFREAAALVLPGADFAERRPEAADAEVVKTLVSVSKNAREGGCEAPRAVAEIFDARQATIADRAYDGEVEILATDRMVSRLIAQAVHLKSDRNHLTVSGAVRMISKYVLKA